VSSRSKIARQKIIFYIHRLSYILYLISPPSIELPNTSIPKSHPTYPGQCPSSIVLSHTFMSVSYPTHLWPFSTLHSSLIGPFSCYAMGDIPLKSINLNFSGQIGGKMILVKIKMVVNLISKTSPSTPSLNEHLLCEPIFHPSYFSLDNTFEVRVKVKRHKNLCILIFECIFFLNPCPKIFRYTCSYGRNAVICFTFHCCLVVYWEIRQSPPAPSGGGGRARGWERQLIKNDAM
jgi:hypothetical protein